MLSQPFYKHRFQDLRAKQITKGPHSQQLKEESLRALRDPLCHFLLQHCQLLPTSTGSKWSHLVVMLASHPRLSQQ